MSGSRLGALMRRERRRLDMSRAELAGRAGVSERTLIRIEAGEGSLAAYRTVAAVLGLRMAGVPGDLPDLHRAITATRMAWGIGVAELAALAGVSPGVVYRLEAGEDVHLASVELVVSILWPSTRGTARKQVGSTQPATGDEWWTPPAIYEPVIAAMGSIDLDPCGHDDAPIPVLKRFTISDDGLNRGWEGRVFVNPPFSQKRRWIEKAVSEFECGNIESGIILSPVIMHHKYFKNTLEKHAEFIILKCRPKYYRPIGLSSTISPFPMMLSVLSNDDYIIEVLNKNIDGVVIKRSISHI